MKNRHKRHILAAGMLLALILAILPGLVGAQSQVITSTAVAGELNEQFAKHYLGLRPIDPSSSLEVTVTYEPADARNFGFYIFDEASIVQIVQGGKRLNQVPNNVAALSADGSGSLTAVIGQPVGKFTIVVYNDSTRPVRYELRVKNGLLRDDGGQVKDLNAPAQEEEAAAPAPATEEPTQAPTAAAEEEAAPTATATPAPAAAEAPAPAMQKVVVRASKLSGELPERFDQHYLGLIPLDRRSRVVITMTYDPQDQQALDQGLNFYVLDRNGLNKVLFQGARPELVNIAAGNPVMAAVKTRRAELAPPLGSEYTVIVSNGSNVPAVYHLEVENGVLVDDSGQTMESKSAQPAQAAEEGAAEAAPAPAAVTGEQALPEVEIGSVYVVQRGDTLGTIAKAAYGNVKLYKELCAYNNIEDCNRIEVGDEIVIPALDELTSGATAPATPEATPTPEAQEPEATPTEEATPETTPETTPEATPETTPEATPEATPETTPEATPEATPTEEAMMGGETIVDVLAADGRFEILKAALQLADLDGVLKGEGPFTLFAPTDAAFALLPEETLDSLLQDPAAMAEVLKYHVIPGEVRAEDLTGSISAETLQGGMITIVVGDDGTIVVNEAKVLDTNLEASNGVIHVIDAVLIPGAQ